MGSVGEKSAKEKELEVEFQQALAEEQAEGARGMPSSFFPSQETSFQLCQAQPIMQGARICCPFSFRRVSQIRERCFEGVGEDERIEGTLSYCPPEVAMGQRPTVT